MTNWSFIARIMIVYLVGVLVGIYITKKRMVK